MEILAWLAVVVAAIVLFVILANDKDGGKAAGSAFWVGLCTVAVLMFAQKENSKIWAEEIPSCGQLFFSPACERLVEMSAAWNSLYTPGIALICVSAFVFIAGGIGSFKSPKQQ